MDYKRVFFIALLVGATGLNGSVLATTYGGNQYGRGVYSGTETTQTAGPTNTTGTPVCDKQAPSYAPHLFQIDRTSQKATLYFAPAGNPHDRYVIAYGSSEKNIQFGVEFAQRSVPSALKYTINQLDPKQNYFFRIRAGNACMPGTWSGGILTKKNTNKNQVVSYYPGFLPRIAQLIKGTPSVKEPKKVIKSKTPATKIGAQSKIPQPMNTEKIYGYLQDIFNKIRRMLNS